MLFGKSDHDMLTWGSCRSRLGPREASEGKSVWVGAASWSRGTGGVF